MEPTSKTARKGCGRLSEEGVLRKASSAASAGSNRRGWLLIWRQRCNFFPLAGSFAIKHLHNLGALVIIRRYNTYLRVERECQQCARVFLSRKISLPRSCASFQFLTINLALISLTFDSSRTRRSREKFLIKDIFAFSLIKRALANALIR